MQKKSKLEKLFADCLKITSTTLEKAIQVVDQQRTSEKVVLVAGNWSAAVIDDLVTACSGVQSLKPAAIW